MAKTYGANGLDYVGHLASKKEHRDPRGYDVVIVARERSSGELHLLTNIAGPTAINLLDDGMEAIDGQRLPPD